MFNRVRNAFMNVVGGVEPVAEVRDSDSSEERDRILSPKFPYTRPHFLQIHSEEEIQVSADHHIRPIIVPRDINWNEDQACIHRGLLTRPERNSQVKRQTLSMPYTYFGLFDGHAGVGAAVAAANQLHHILHEKLMDVLDILLPPLSDNMVPVESSAKGGVSLFFPEKEVSPDSVITGALEAAFWDMDQLIGEDKHKYRVKGGCTALVALFIAGKVFVANAGDSRAVMCRGGQPVPLSNDFTPESERQRVRHLAALQPELLGGEYTHLDYFRRPSHKDLGKRVLYRDWYMTGWGYKTVTAQDLKLPVVYGEGKRSRVLSTIGVTRGFGDHDLKALYSNIPIKPFLMCQPEVRIVRCCGSSEFSDSDVIVLGTDGLWDVTSNDKVAEIVHRSLKLFPATDIQKVKYRYTLVAQDLVMQSRGKLQERNWRTNDGKSATIDDISVFVIPLHNYKRDHEVWDATVSRLRDSIPSPPATPMGERVLQDWTIEDPLNLTLQDNTDDKENEAALVATNGQLVDLNEQSMDNNGVEK
ncbi:hypothetical protein B566_EDAN008295 [Ephemera danica]|nr:hypothetical protein B566_EDAN008295 [Ephemera danica]